MAVQTKPWHRRDLARLPTWEDGPNPILAVEIPSPSSRRYDARVKRTAYLERLGIPVVWLVDYKRREIHVSENGAEACVERSVVEWQPAGAREPLRLDVQALFNEAMGPA